MDVLAVPNVCGADVMKTSNFALKPLKLTVFTVMTPCCTKCRRRRRSPASARPRILETRPSRPTAVAARPGLQVGISHTPIVVSELAISLSPEELAMFNAVKRSDI